MQQHGVDAGDIEEDDVSSGYSGTFRWKASKRLPSMPPIATENALAADPEHLQEAMKGWMQYLVTRCETVPECQALISKAKEDLSLIDCLSSAVSVGYALTEMGIFPFQSNDQLQIVCVGCSSKCEERILRETNCWNELGRFLVGADSSCKVWIVGPEVATTLEVFNRDRNDIEPVPGNMEFGLFRGTSIEFFRSHSSLVSAQTVVVGLNCGFGNWENPLPARYNLLFNWLPDLYFLTGTKIPLVFTCANDFADVAGETGVMHRILGAKFVLSPQENPFGFASTLIPPGVKPEDAGKLFTRGNSFLYCVQGHDKDRRVVINVQSQDTRVAEFISQYNKIGKSGSDFLPITSVAWLHSRPINQPRDLRGVDLAPKLDVDAKDITPMAEAAVNDGISSDDAVGTETTTVEGLPAERCIASVAAPNEAHFFAGGNSFEISQSIEANRLVVVIRLHQNVVSCSLKDIDVCYSESSGEFLLAVVHNSVAAAGVTEEVQFKSLQPIIQASIAAKVSKKRQTLTITADVLVV